MPKSRHHKRKHQNRPQSLLFNPAKELEQIDELIEAGDSLEALKELKALAHQAPRHTEIFEKIFMLAVQLGDQREMLEPAIRLVELQPHFPEHHFNLYGVYMQNLFPVLALETGRHFLRRWPDLELSKDIRKDVDKLVPLLENDLARLKFPPDSRMEFAVLHERVQVSLARKQYDETQRLATQLIAVVPQFAAAYNNRSLANWIRGDAEAALADVRRVLEFEPDNVHALSNLTRFLRLTNRLDEAREIAERLKASSSPSLDVWTKKAEAFSYLSDDAAVLKVAEQAEQTGALFGEQANPFLLHLSGVAAARLGDEKRARKYWQEAIKMASFERAQANLADLDKPLSERDGPWPFELWDWLAPALFDDFAKAVGKAADSKSIKNLKGAAQSYIEKYPHVMALAPVLLERGDPFSREFILRLAQLLETPEAIALLKDFVHSPHGPDKLRQSTLKFLQEAKIFENNVQLSFWRQGKQTEIIGMNWKIDGVPYERPPAPAIEPSVRGFDAMQSGQWDQAYKFFSQALAAAPNSASIRFNLALIAGYDGKLAQSLEEVKALAARHPKYSYAHCHLALHALANGRIEEARERLKVIFTLEHFHIDEFINFCQVQILFFIIGEPDLDAAKQWLQMWQQLAPNHPKLEIFRPIVQDSMFARLQAKRMIAWLKE